MTPGEREELEGAISFPLNVAGLLDPDWVDACKATALLADAIAPILARMVAERVAAETERCAKVAENCSFGVDIGEWLVMTKKELSARACREVAAAIRSATR